MDKNTTKSQVLQWLRANQRKTHAEIAAGTGIKRDLVDVFIFDLVRSGDVIQSDGWDRAARDFRYEVKR